MSKYGFLILEEENGQGLSFDSSLRSIGDKKNHA